MKKLLGILLALSLAVSSAGAQSIFEKIGGTISNIFASDGFKLEDLEGTWEYQSPAVSFKSENALKKVGGAAAATTVETKLAPYYQNLGLNKTVLTVDAEHNFTMKMGLATLKGTIAKDDDNNLIFSFNAFGRIPLGSVSARATKAGSTLNLTFDATKMVEILSKVAGVVNRPSLNAIVSLLQQYDGIFIGFKLKKQ